MTSEMKKPGGRERTWRPEFKKGPKMWDPAKVGIVSGYPSTEAKWVALRERASQNACRLHQRGVFHRRGVPDGWAGRKDELAAVRADADERAARAVETMRGRNEIPSDDDYAFRALRACMAIMLDPSATTANRMTGARIMLRFCKGTAPRRKEDALETAEEMLAALRAG